MKHTVVYNSVHNTYEGTFPKNINYNEKCWIPLMLYWDFGWSYGRIMREQMENYVDTLNK